MNQYIIDREELEQLLTIGIDIGYNTQLLVLESNIRSRPYNPQAEREKVLYSILKSIDEMQSAVTTNASEFNDGRDCAYNFVRRVIESERLRTL